VIDDIDIGNMSY